MTALHVVSHAKPTHAGSAVAADAPLAFVAQAFLLGAVAGLSLQCTCLAAVQGFTGFKHHSQHLHRER